MKVIFLDIDGVLNTCDGLETGINRGLVEHLNKLVRDSGASVVVSSSWRIAGLRRMRMILREHGFTGRVSGVTPVMSLGVRGLEIQAWIDRCRWRVTSFVILDDNDDMADLHPHLIQTDYRKGLTSDDVSAALDRLRLAFQLGQTAEAVVLAPSNEEAAVDSRSLPRPAPHRMRDNRETRSAASGPVRPTRQLGAPRST
jgi:hypothetical protein